eukprot:12215530-Alexandrium_andersonii.AAC.1
MPSSRGLAVSRCATNRTPRAWFVCSTCVAACVAGSSVRMDRKLLPSLHTLLAAPSKVMRGP